METHCNHFLKTFKPGKKLHDLLYEDITEELVGSYATYLSKHATKYCKADGELLMWNSIAGYFSAFKTFVVKKFRNKPVPHSLSEIQMKMMTTEMRSKKIKMCNSNNDSWVNPHAMASDEDNKALGALCYWDGTTKSAEVHRGDSLLDDYLFSMLYHLVVHDPTSCSDETDNTSLMFSLWAAHVTNSGGSMAESMVVK